MNPTEPVIDSGLTGLDCGARVQALVLAASSVFSQGDTRGHISRGLGGNITAQSGKTKTTGNPTCAYLTDCDKTCSTHCGAAFR